MTRLTDHNRQYLYQYYQWQFVIEIIFIIITLRIVKFTGTIITGIWVVIKNCRWIVIWWGAASRLSPPLGSLLKPIKNCKSSLACPSKPYMGCKSSVSHHELKPRAKRVKTQMLLIHRNQSRITTEPGALQEWCVHFYRSGYVDQNYDCYAFSSDYCHFQVYQILYWHQHSMVPCNGGCKIASIVTLKWWSSYRIMMIIVSYYDDHYMMIWWSSYERWQFECHPSVIGSKVSKEAAKYLPDHPCAFRPCASPCCQL